MAAPDVPNRSAVLSRALKVLRRRRGLTVTDMSDALRIAPRSYEYFEAGCSRVNLERLHQAAEILDADPYALLAAMDIGSAEFAVRCSENKLMTILTMSLQDFDTKAGDAITQLDPQTLMSAFTRMFDQLGAIARERASLAGRRSGTGELGRAVRSD